MYIVVIYNFINIVQDGYIYYKQGCLFIVGYFSEFFCDLLYDYRIQCYLFFFVRILIIKNISLYVNIILYWNLNENIDIYFKLFG